LPKLNTCHHCRAFFDADQTVCPHCGTSIVARRVRERGGIVDRIVPRPGAVTIALIGANILLYVAMLLVQKQSSGFGEVAGGTMFRFGGNVRETITGGEWYRLVCSVFLHFSIWHILFNCYALNIVGQVAERFYGPAKFFAVYVFMGLTASLVSLIYNNLDQLHIWIGAGASGAIMGVMGLIIAFAHRRKMDEVKYLLMRWAVIVIVFGFIIGADNAAHIGGLVVGLALGSFLKTEEITRLSPAAVRFWDLAAIAGVLVVLGSFGWTLVANGVVSFG
jgi:rhomboid protease GluP